MSHISDQEIDDLCDYREVGMPTVLEGWALDLRAARRALRSIRLTCEKADTFANPPKVILDIVDEVLGKE